MHKSLAYCLISGGVLVAATSALAQAPSGAAPDKPGAHARMHEPPPFSKPTERADARLAYQKTALKITGAQEPQWNAYADKVRRMAAERETRMAERMKKWKEASGAKHEHHRPTAIERMEREQAMHADAVKRINDLLEVQKPLYAALSEEQKRVADVVLVSREGGPMGGRMGGRMGRHAGGSRGERGWSRG